ncbi:MAG: hypothetical protein WC596_04175 [Candidatus Shapirobacteria bacterium]
MDFITQDQAKIYIKEWFAAGETEDIIKTKLANYGFVDITIKSLLNEVRPITPETNKISNPADQALRENDHLLSEQTVSQIQPEKVKGSFNFKNLKWYEWLAVLPAFVLLITGGFIGGAVGAIGWIFSLKIIRKESRSIGTKIFMVIGLDILCYIAYFILALIFEGFIFGKFK